MLRTPSRGRPLNVFKKGSKQSELPKTAPTTPEDEDPGVTVMSREIDPTVLSTDVLQQIVGKQNPPSSPSVGEHRSYSSQSGNLREEKKEDDSPVEAQPPTPDDVVSKTLNYFDDMCRMPKVDELEELDGANQPKPYLLLNHIAGFDDLTTSPSLPSETTANESSAPYSRDTTTTASKLKRSSTAHNHENFEVVLDPSSVIKESSQKQNRGNRFLPFKKKTNDESNAAAARDDEAELKESFDRLLNGTEKLDKEDRTRARQMRNKAGAVSKDEPKEENPTVLEDLNDILCGTADDEKTESEEKNTSAITMEDEKNIKQLQEMVPVKQVVAKKGKKSLGQRLKKIRNSAFMLGRKGAKSTKASGQTKADASPAISPDDVKLNVDANGAPMKPKQTWKSVVDPNTGRTYYYHRKTRETTWVKPESLTRYEIAFQKWVEATAAFHAKQADKEENKVVDESQPEEKAATSESEPKEVASDPAEKSDAAVEKTPTPVVKDTKKDVPAKPVETAQNNTQTINEMEPLQEESPFDAAGPKDNGDALFMPRSPARFGRTMTHASKASARSNLTERTEKIRNTGKGRGSSFNPISENTSSYRVPSRVPVYRERQLVVEDLTESRLSAESYETSGGRRGRIVRGRARQIEPTPETYDGDMDTDDYGGTSGYDNDTYGTDSVSALSENDTDFLSRKDNFDQARRRALDAAIESEDWDLAAALSDGVRGNSTPKTYEKSNGSWDQSELDKLIANNDWTAVKNYIAKMREQSKQDLAKAPPANKRIGSRSQMQHNSNYVSESSSEESSIDGATSASESEM